MKNDTISKYPLSDVYSIMDVKRKYKPKMGGTNAMKRWRETNVRFHLGIAAAFALAAALALGLVYSFNQYKDQIIEEQ